MRKRKKTAVHGTLGMTCAAVKFNFQQVLLKTLIPTMNTSKDMAVLNIIKTDRKLFKYSQCCGLYWRCSVKTTLKTKPETEANARSFKVSFLSKRKVNDETFIKYTKY